MGKAIITRILNKGGTPPHQYPHQYRGNREYRDEHRDEYRVAVYCRVAAWGEGQENNYMNVSNYYKQNIRMQSGWKLVSIYADVGLTRVQTRPRFFDMLRDGQSGFFDILICESVRTFSHDMKDAVEKIRKLKSWGVKVIFEREGFDTNSYITSSLLETLNSFGNEEKDEPFSPVFGYRLVRDEYGGQENNGDDSGDGDNGNHSEDCDEYGIHSDYGGQDENGDENGESQQNKCADCERNGENSEQNEQSVDTHSDDNQSEDGEYINDSEYSAYSQRAQKAWSCQVSEKMKTKTTKQSKAQHTINTVGTGRNRFNEASRHGEQDEGCNIIAYWKCGIITTLPSMAQSASQNPRRKALLWDNYILQHSDLYPDLAAEAVTARFRNHVNDSNSIQANSSNNYRGNYRGGSNNSSNSSNSNGGNYRCNLSQRANNTNNTNNDFSDYEEND